MLAGLQKFWTDLMTEDDGGTTYCPVRVISASLVSGFHGAVGWQLIKHGVFDPIGYATGGAALLAATGGAIGVKSKLGADRITPPKGAA